MKIILSIIIKKLIRIKPNKILQFFQNELKKNFNYDDDTIINQLQIYIKKLRKTKINFPPHPKTNEKPTLPFDLKIKPNYEQIIKKKNPKTINEHFKKNPHKNKTKYLKKRELNATTPELPRNRTDSNKISKYSINDTSTYYNTTTNSKISFSKTSIQNSRTSYTNNSNIKKFRQTPIINNLNENLIKIKNEHPSRNTTIKNITQKLKTPSIHSNYNNIKQHTNPNSSSKTNFHKTIKNNITKITIHHEISNHIPANKSDKYIKSRNRANKNNNQNYSHTNQKITIKNIANSYRQKTKNTNELNNNNPEKYISKLKINTNYNEHPNEFAEKNPSHRNNHNSSKIVITTTNFNQRLINKQQIQIKTNQL